MGYVTVVELDHIFIATARGASEADKLVERGFSEGSPNRHAGQGTANRRFFFRNAMLEFLWIDNEEEIQSEITRPTLLHERLHRSDPMVSPFGVCFRPANREAASAPFPAWSYKPAYLPDHLRIEIGRDTPLAEPMWFFLSFSARPDQAPPGSRQPLQHANGFREITSARIAVPSRHDLSPAAQVAQVHGVALVQESAHGLEIEFDHGGRGVRYDFRPGIPLVVRG